MSPKQTIFQRLKRLNICHAVIAGDSHFLSNKEISIKDYCIIGSKKDRKCLQRLGFVDRPDYLSHRLVLEYDLTFKETKLFRNILFNKQEYVLVQKNDYGRVYEQKDKSLKKYCLPGSR